MRKIRSTYYLIVALFWLGVALPMAMTMLLARARGLNLFEIGLVVGVYSLTIVLLEVPTGGLADVIGRKRVATLAYGCIALASLTFLFAFSLPVFLLAFSLNGIGRALSSGALDAWFIDALQAADPDIDLQPELARANTVALLALGGGTLLGGLIPQAFAGLPPDGTAVLTPLSMPVLFAVISHFTTLTAAALLIVEERPRAAAGHWPRRWAETAATIGTALALSRRNPTILRLLGATAASGLALISLETLWQPHFAGLLGGGAEHSFFFGLVMGGNFIVGVAGTMAATPLSRLLRRRYGLVCAIFQGVRGALLIALAWQTQAPLATALFWLTYLAMGVANSPHSALMNREIPAAQRSSMLSIESLAGYAGAIVGSVGLGYVAEHASIGAAWIISGVVLVVSLGLYLQIDVRARGTYAQKTSILEAH
jgi:DHA1 family quinolone resistance protein-like MFS transporter